MVYLQLDAYAPPFLSPELQKCPALFGLMNGTAYPAQALGQQRDAINRFTHTHTHTHMYRYKPSDADIRSMLGKFSSTNAGKISFEAFVDTLTTVQPDDPNEKPMKIELTEEDKKAIRADFDQIDLDKSGPSVGVVL